MEQFGEYRLLEKIGEGGMGEVFLAHAQKASLPKVCVIKRILPNLQRQRKFLEMFLDEMQILQTLQHPNLVNAFECSATDKVPFIAMEYVEGTTLATLLDLQRAGRISFPLSLRLYCLEQILRGLSYLHQPLAGKKITVVHRDLAPENILIAISGAVKIADFGLSKAIEDAYLTKSGLIKGHFHYLSPEQALGEEINEKSDLFSFAVMAYEVLTEEKLFPGKVWHSVLQKIVDSDPSGAPDWGDKLPEGLRDPLRACLARKPAARRLNAAGLQQRLEQMREAQTAQNCSKQLAQLVVQAATLETQTEESDSAVFASYLSLQYPFWEVTEETTEEKTANAKLPSLPEPEIPNRQANTSAGGGKLQTKRPAPPPPVASAEPLTLRERKQLELARPIGQSSAPKSSDPAGPAYTQRFERYKNLANSGQFDEIDALKRYPSRQTIKRNVPITLLLLALFVVLLSGTLIWALRKPPQTTTTAEPAIVVPKRYGKITLEAKPEDVQIFLNGKKQAGGTPITLSRITPYRKHNLVVRKAGYQPYITDFVLHKGENRRFRIQLQKTRRLSGRRK